MNWDDLRIFLAVAGAGSFSGASRALGINQSTVSRRTAELEHNLQVRLVERGPDGITLTSSGRDLAIYAGNVEAEFQQIATSVAGRDMHLGGRLSITCVDMMIDRFLAPHIVRFCEKHPDIELSLTTPIHSLDLMKREADVAQQVEVAVESLVRDALGEQLDEELPALVQQSLLQVMTGRLHVGPVFLLPVDAFELGVDLDKATANPVVECSDV